MPLSQAEITALIGLVTMMEPKVQLLVTDLIQHLHSHKVTTTVTTTTESVVTPVNPILEMLDKK